MITRFVKGNVAVDRMANGGIYILTSVGGSRFVNSYTICGGQDFNDLAVIFRVLTLDASESLTVMVANTLGVVVVKM